MAIDTIATNTGIILSTDDQESTIPIVYFDKITLDSVGDSSIAVSVKMHIEIPLGNDFFGIEDNDIMKYLNLLLVRSESESVTSAHELGIPLTSKVVDPSISDVVYNNSLYGFGAFLTTTEVAIGDSEITNTDSGKQILNLSFQIEDFPIGTDHLSYFAQCSLDVDELALSLGISVPSLATLLSLKGPVSGEKIITDGLVNETSYVYTVTSVFPKNLAGTFWTGPVLQDLSGKWASAQWEASGGELIARPTNPPLNLEKIPVRNSKIQDFRIIKQMSSLSINLSPDDLFPIIIQGRDTFNNSIQHPDAYISNASLSRDMESNCRFMFEFDYDKFITKESKFGKILTNPFVPEATKRKIYLYSRITSLQIIRRQVETARGYNRLNSPILGISRSELNPEITIIAETASDQENNNALLYRSIYNPGKPCRGGTFLDAAPQGEDGGESTLVGSVGEIFGVKGSPATTRTIMATDNSSKCLTDGSFQYGVRIEMEDGTVRFLNERLRKLQVVRDYLVGYNNILQTPKQSFEFGTNRNVVDYYTKLFLDFRNHGISIASAEPGTSPNQNQRNKKETSLAASIEGLRTELGISVGALADPSYDDALFPWIVAPEYFVDTMQSIADFRELRFSQSLQKMPSVTVQKNAQKTFADQKSGTVKFGNEDLKTGQGSISSFLSSTTLSRPGKRVDLSKRAYQDLFNEKSAKSAIQGLLDPQIATPESVTVIINMFDILEQKIRTMMGTSVELKLPDVGTKRRGVSRNSKVSVLNLEDYFVELFDAQLSGMPAIDYMGFANSPGNVFSNPPPANINLGFSPGAKVDNFAGPNAKNSSDLVAGLFSTTVSEFQIRIGDEEALYDVVMTDELVESKKFDLEMEENRQIAIIRERRAQQQKLQLDRVKQRQEQRLAGPDKNARDRQNQNTKKAIAVNKSSSIAFAAAIISDGTTGVIDKTSNMSTAWNAEQYTGMQNKVVAKMAGDFEMTPITRNQDAINHIMNKMGVQSSNVGTPLNANISLNKGAQKSLTSDVPVKGILGEDSNERRGTNTNNTSDACLPGQGSAPEDLARYRNEAIARPITQALMNIVAQNGAFNMVSKKVNGAPTTMAKVFSKDKTITPTAGTSQSGKLPRQFRNFPEFANAQVAAKMQGPSGGQTPLPSSKAGTKFAPTVNTAAAGNTRLAAADSIYKSAMFKMNLDTLADVWIFRGYELDTDGNIMIKKPIWELPNPGVWATSLEDLSRTDSRYNAIFCALRKVVSPENGIGLNSGLDFAETNTYFLITKHGASLFDTSSVLEDLVIQFPNGRPPSGVVPPVPTKSGGTGGTAGGGDVFTRGTSKKKPPPSISGFGIPIAAQQSVNPGAGKEIPSGTSTTVKI